MYISSSCPERALTHQGLTLDRWRGERRDNRWTKRVGWLEWDLRAWLNHAITLYGDGSFYIILFCVGVQPFELCLSDSHSWSHPSVLLPSIHGSSQLLRPLPPSAKSAKKALLQSRPTKWREGLSPVTLLGYVERERGRPLLRKRRGEGGERHDRKARKREERESVGGAAVVPPLLSTHLPRLQSFL